MAGRARSRGENRVPFRRPISRDLLFGMVTLQHGFIDEDQFVAAVQSWAGAPPSGRSRTISRNAASSIKTRAADIEAHRDAPARGVWSIADQSWAAVPRGQSTCEPQVRVGDAERSRWPIAVWRRRRPEKAPVAAVVMWPDRPPRRGSDFGCSGPTPGVV